MKDKEKQTIAAYRQEGYSYTQISKMMDLSINSIKTYCRRHDLGGKAAYEAPIIDDGSKCQNCGKDIFQNPGRKAKRFCCDKCRNKWWNEHMDQVKKKANYEYTCPLCKKVFTAYGNSNRKYCSHACYVEDRFFGGDANA